MKKFICMLLVFLIAAFSITPVYAVDKENSLGPPEIVPQFTHKGWRGDALFATILSKIKQIKTFKR